MKCKSSLLKKSIKILLVAALTALAVFTALTWSIWYPGVTPSQTAQILIEDDKFGGRALGMASYWGDAIFPALRDASNDFTVLNGRNTEVVMMAFAQDPSEESLEFATKLYERDDINAKAIGAAGLAVQGKLPDAAFMPNGYLYRSLDYNWAKPLSNMERITSNQEDSIEYALIISGYAKSNKVLPPIIKILNYRNIPYSLHAEACDALKDIGDKQAIPDLEAAMKDKNFYAIPNAFAALFKLGDPDAVPLAIKRITPEIEGYNEEFIIDELKKATGKNFGLNQKKWQEWWDHNNGNPHSNGNPHR